MLETIFNKKVIEKMMFDWQVILHLNFTTKSSFFNEINYWTWSDFRKQFRHGGQSNTKQLLRALVNETQWSKIRSTVKSTWQAKHRGWASPRSKCPCVRYLCPILILWIIISSRQGKRNMLITLTLGSIEGSLFSVSQFQCSCHYLSAWKRMSDV